MKCPRCGSPMNHHADKVFQVHDADSSTQKTFGGAVVEIHSCLACGAVATRSSS